MSGGSSANMRASSSIVWRRRGELTSSEIANATAQSLLAPRLGRRLARELDAEPRDVDPVARVALREPRALLGLGRRQDRPGGGREDVAAGREVPAVHVEHGLGRLVQRPGAPQLLVGVCGPRGAAPRSRRRRRGSRSARRRAATRRAGSRATAPRVRSPAHHLPARQHALARGAGGSKAVMRWNSAAALDDLGVRQRARAARCRSPRSRTTPSPSRRPRRGAGRPRRTGRSAWLSR